MSTWVVTPLVLLVSTSRNDFALPRSFSDAVSKALPEMFGLTVSLGAPVGSTFCVGKLVPPDPEPLHPLSATAAAAQAATTATHLDAGPVKAFTSRIGDDGPRPYATRLPPAVQLSGGVNVPVRASPAARPFAAITSAILREASSIISSPSIAEPFAPPASDV